MYLGINLAVEPISIGIVSEDKIISEIAVSSNYAYTENLNQEVQNLLKLNSLAYSDIKAIGVVNGPGSYTGLRIGVTFAKTIAQVLNTPVFPISTLEAYAYQYRHFEGIYFSIIPACRGEVNACLYGVKNNQVTALTEEFTGALEKVLSNITKVKEKINIIGDLNVTIINRLKGNPNLELVNKTSLQGSTVAFMAMDGFQGNEKGDYRGVFPKYSHLPNTN
ncbi:tRNA (adenosine(37)-N6)-threonylcarbamoyltransferase complex dimerization subunit type 1 TsaB [Candidatus Margulisiibacteriota bacterium]